MTQREVTLEGGVPWGFRMNGGVDQKYPLKVSRVNPGSKAAQRGIREGDLITSIQGEKTQNLTNNEAHNLLKRSGSTLKLGLNEAVENTPTRRQYRTIHQETHQETVKKSSVTYTLKETIEKSSGKPKNHECEIFKSSEFTNGKDSNENGTNVTIVTNFPVSEKSTSSSSTSTPSTLIPEGRNISSDHAVASRQSSYSNCSSIPDEGSQQETQLDRSGENQDMNDGQGRMSKSKKRRLRKKNLLNRTVSQESQSQSEAEIDEIDSTAIKGIVDESDKIVREPSSKNLEILRLKRIEHKYKVESPKELKLEHARDVKKLKAKSKSLDDDDLLKIQELSEASESEDGKYQPNVVISEASSDENLLDDFDLKNEKTRKSALTSICLQLSEDNKIEATSKISPQEEQELRTFLGGLNLANSPEESAKELYEKTAGLEDSKAKKLQKRKQLEEYFMPIAENPRYLDAISEEASDISDKECGGASRSVQHLKQGTPEQDSTLPGPEAEIPILVAAKVLEPTNTKQEGICTTDVVPVEQQKAEVVYLLDSSTSSISTEDFDDALENIEDEYDDDTDELEMHNPTADGLNTEENFSLQGNLESSKEIGTKEQKVKISTDLDNPRDNLQIHSNESYSSITSSQINTSKTISAPLNYPKVNPSPLASSSAAEAKKSSSVQTLFDYTKTPNVLRPKEPETIKAKPKIPPKENILSNSKEKCDVARSEARSVSAMHTSKKLVNGHLENEEFRKVKVDEVSTNGDVEVVKDFEEYVLNPNNQLNGNLGDKPEAITTEALKDTLEVFTEPNDKESVTEEISKSETKSASSTSNTTINSIKSENSISESKKEFVLRHVIMNSQDSNKTDSQKLVEFEKIKKLNNEIKDKINKKELIGPSFRKSKSPAVDLLNVTENGHDLVVMSCEQPSKNFVEKRVNEFSAKDFQFEKLTETIKNEGVVDSSTTTGNNLIKSRIITFSNGSEKGKPEQTKLDESSQSSIIVNTKISDIGKNEPQNSLTSGTNKALIENNSNEYKIIPIKLENIYENVPKKEEGSVLKNLLSFTIDTEFHRAPNNIAIQEKKEVIIPIVLETNNNQNMQDKSKGEVIIPVTIENTPTGPSKLNPAKPSDILEKIIPVEIEGDAKSNFSLPLKVENCSRNDKVSTFTKQDIQSISKTLEGIAEKNIPNNRKADEVKTKSPSSSQNDISPPVPPRPKENEIENSPPVPPPRRSKTLLLNKRIANNLGAEVKQFENRGVLAKGETPAGGDVIYSNVLSPPRPASASSESSESEESSRCTVKYNPNSSLADVASIAKDEELLEANKTNEPLSLRDIVLKVLVSLPFGEEILKELAEVSKSIENFTNKLPFKGLASENNTVSVQTNQDMWTNRSNSYEEEQRKILELHKNFALRRRHDEGSRETAKNNDDQVIITNIGNRESDLLSPNRLLTIIREEPSETEPTQEFLFPADNSEQRLKAKNLGEWLTLARHKSKSTSNLDCTNIPINNLRRTIQTAQSEQAKFSNTRRRSLPQEIYEKQLIDIMEKEREIQRELEMLEEEKRKLRAEIAPSRQKEFQVDDFYVSKKGDFAEIREDVSSKQERPASMPVFPTEFFRQQMYEEYMDKFSERQERKQHKVIKISSSNELEQEKDVLLRSKEIIHPIEIEQEFMDRVKEKLRKNNSTDSDSSEKKDDAAEKVDSSKIEENNEAPPVIVLDRDKVKGVETLPRHLQEFVGDLTTQPEDRCFNKIMITQCDRKCCKEARRVYRALAKNKTYKSYSLLHEIDASLNLAKGFLFKRKGIWSPGQPRRPPSPPGKQYQRTCSENSENEPVLPIWTPKSANSSPLVERKEFRPLNFQSPVLGRKNRTRSETIPTPDSTSEPPWKVPEGSSDTALHLSSTLDRRLPTSQSSPGFGSFSTSPRLPRAQNPTITLLQKAREGQLPRGAQYLNQDRKLPNDRPPIKYPGEILYHIKNEYTSESDSERPRKMADLAPRKFEGIGPTTKDGMPLILRSEVKNEDQSKWYKRMYDTIHKQKPHRDEYVTIKYKQKRAQYPYSSGYLSEPEPGAYDSDFTEYKYQTLDRRRTPQTPRYISNNSTMPRNVPEKSYSSSDIIRNSHVKYNNQPGRIENYRPGHSSISEKEAKQWWDEVMDIFDGHLEQQSRVPPQKPRSFINQALKESGYESDSTLVFKRKEETAASQLSPKDQREVYKMIQKGGDVPFQGLRKPAPERPKETDLVEFFPMSPTLTKIRIHKSFIPPNEFLIPPQEYFCYPATMHQKTFANFKRTAPSTLQMDSASGPPVAPTPPPSPPKRRSSRNNTTLRLISTMRVKTDKNSTCKRHETCFTSGSSMNKSNVNYLRDKITCKLTPSGKRKGDSNSKLSVVKSISASPDLRSRISSTLSSCRDPKTSARRVQSSTRISADKPQQRGLYKSGSTGSIISKKSSTESLSSRTSTPVKTFGSEKRKFDLTLPVLSSKSKLVKTKSDELLSPTEVKKGITNISKCHAQYKESLAPLRDRNSLPIKIGITEKGKQILKSSIKRPLLSPKTSRITIGQKSRTSTESLNSPKRKTVGSNMKSSAKTEGKKSQPKTKKDQINGTLKQNAADKKCLSKATGAEVAKKLANIKTPVTCPQMLTLESNHFFRNLFLRNMKPSASFTLPKNTWLIEKTNQLTRRRASLTEPSIGAMQIYLKHTKPVTDSRFISLDVIRSRSASPKSVTFSENISTQGTSKRSKSLPSKMVFSQTSRPITPLMAVRGRSPILKPSGLGREPYMSSRQSPSPPRKLTFSQPYRPKSPILKQPLLPRTGRSPSPPKKLFFSETSRPISPEVRRKNRPESSPPPSPRIPRSPSCRKIMQFKSQQEQNRPQELTLYTCPDLNHSTTSLDSFRSEDYQVYLKDLVYSDKNEKFKELNHFYSDIEKVGELEQKFSLKPRRKDENEIIDYDRWMEVRSREKAEHELQHLYHHLKTHEKEKGFLFLPKDVKQYKWKLEADRGLRIKEKSVENLKEEFERLRCEESQLESARRREMDYKKDTYKPLWRGTSVINLANILSEKRSQSEGRVKSTRQKFLDHDHPLSHGIGSRIWSSLSMEQVNNLKKQLQDIYGDEVAPSEDSCSKDYAVEVSRQVEKTYIPHLTVRRNSDSSKHDLMSEDEKKTISHTLSKEVLEKIANRRKEDKLALPLIKGKEMMGAIATQEAHVKTIAREAVKPLAKPIETVVTKQNSISETESASTDDSAQTVINLQDVQKKVEYFEKAKDIETYVPTVYRPAEDGSEEPNSPPEENKPAEQDSTPKTIHQSKSCQSLKEFFGQTELVKFATLPLAATRKSEYKYTKKSRLRALDISPIRTISEANSIDSLSRSRSASPYYEEAQALARKGEVRKLRKQFEFFEDFFGEKKLKRSRSENDLKVYGHVEDLRKKYEYPIYSGRGRSRVKRGGMVSPVWLKAEDRYMPHINIISKIASLYSFSKHKTDKEASKSMEELAEILGCPVGEVERMKEKFDKIREHEDEISLMGHMYTSSPNLKELRDITPYLTANWIAHRYPRSEDNTRSLSSPEASMASRDTSLVRKDRYRPNSSSPFRKAVPQSILKPMGEKRSERFETSSRYSKEPDLPPPPPPPKSQGAVRSQEPESPRKYVENEVTIHYKTPIRTEVKDYVSEDELAHRQAEAMKKIYEEEKKRKYFQVSNDLQEIQDMKSRRHTDNFIPSQKSPISLNRYDDFDDLTSPTKTRTKSPEPRLVAKALYNFVGQTARELTFRKGELIYVRRQIDKNWYEGELNAMVGLFPVNYVEIVPSEVTTKISTITPRKAHEGQARAKYNFVAQTHLELSLAKGELVTLTRKVDDNWFEGKIGGRKGIFPVSYVDVLIDPSDPPPPSTKPVASPAAHSLLLNGSSQGKESMGSHLYTPNVPNPITSRDNGYHHAKPVQISGTGTYSTLPKTNKSPISQALHIETQSDPIPYRALYKYTPQNDDELELLEGDTVYVLEKCDDGWYVGSSHRTGAFGTFPGNYVEKI
ncbi:uncharacterized protein LOC109542836 isoform X5 [Dendroctonus ponderosae]|uniref:uncharacterized protein LOC109542836 isoform X5 n=1 Tax=Dendroctonus ponderosae TaxID=77166 RepID=UPI002034D0BF|nr:uncharacterized protein LOC109542836 isoform X5 [Dendroctonus ponderosae]